MSAGGGDEFIGGDEEETHDPLDPHDVANAAAVKEKAVTDETAALLAQLRRRQDAYKRFFAGAPMSDDVLIVMADLTEFCRGEDTTFDPDERVHTLLTGRNEVYRRIMDHTRLDFDTLIAKRYTRKPQ